MTNVVHTCSGRGFRTKPLQKHVLYRAVWAQAAGQPWQACSLALSKFQPVLTHLCQVGNHNKLVLQGHQTEVATKPQYQSLVPTGLKERTDLESCPLVSVLHHTLCLPLPQQTNATEVIFFLKNGISFVCVLSNIF